MTTRLFALLAAALVAFVVMPAPAWAVPSAVAHCAPEEAFVYADPCTTVRVEDARVCGASGCQVVYEVRLQVALGHCAWVQPPAAIHSPEPAAHCSIPGYEREATFQMTRWGSGPTEHAFRLCVDWLDTRGVSCAAEAWWTHVDTPVLVET